MKLSICTVALLALQAATASIEPILNKLSITEHPDPAKRAQVQDFVKWDSESLFVNGERLMIFGGEFHFFRLPVPDLWLDIFHKVKALGFNCVSFYVHWGLMEGKHGDYLAEGIFALGSFFEAATKAGIYLIARPGPYINAETSGGGFPGWLQRVRGALRTNAPDYLASTDNYIANVDATIAKAQITNGGPIILYQPENEYSGACCNYTFPDPDYFQYVIEQARSAGIVVPMITNDAWTAGHNAPGTGKGSVDIYGYDNYPIGFDCANPTNWPAQENFPTNWRTTHLEQSPSSPLTIPEFQAGAYQPWGGDGFDHCAKLVNAEFERVLYKNNFSFKATILNLYMIFGGTNWGNLGHAGGYTSYDYASPIAEDRNITREKYSELKLIGNFMKVSPSYLNALPLNLTDSKYTSTSDLTVTPLIGQKSKSSFFVLRHSEYASLDSTDYKLHLPTSAGELTIPRLGGTLTLHGRDSKIHVADYDIDGTNILYSTAEIFTWKKFDSRKVLVVYGAAGERHELAVSKLSGASVLEGHQHGLKIEQIKDSVVINWETSSQRRIVEVGDLQIFILDRNSAYNYWVPQLSKDGSSIGYSSTENGASSIIVNAGYLVRSAHTYRDDLHIIADFNTTTTVEVIGAPPHVKNLYINGDRVRHHTDRNGIWSASVEYRAPSIDIPNLDKLEWKYTDGLPELRNDYDDSAWPAADREATNNTFRPLITPTSLYGSDYGFNTGYLVYRGHFVADGTEKTLNISTQGGTAFGSSVWLNQTLLGSWVGSGNYADQNSTYSLPQLEKGKPYVFTVLCDNMGLDGNWVVGQDLMKAPRGVLNYEIPGRDQSDITWKLTGNIGGEDYRDRVRGPLNEGGLYPERQGWHQPKPPTHSWGTASPTADGISKAGVGFFSTEFDLHIPKGWDVPLYFTFANETSMPDPYRVQLYVNGYQYGKFVSHIGPQTSYPVPQGVLNYDGPNWVAVTLWAPEERGAKIEGLKLEYREAVMTGFGDVEPKYIPAYEKREGAY